MALIKLNCMSCGHQMAAGSDREGAFVQCEMCGAMVRVPQKTRQHDPFWKDPGFNQRPPSIAQRLARVLGIFSGLACFIAAGVIMFGGALPDKGIAAPELVFVQGGLLFALAAAYALLGIVYLFAGLNIHNGGAMSAMVVLAIAPLHEWFLSVLLLGLLALPKGAAGDGATADATAKFLMFALDFTIAFMAFLAGFTICSLISLAAHMAPRRIRATWLMTVLSVYGYLVFASIFAVTGYIIMGGAVKEMPQALTDSRSLMINTGGVLVGSTLLWLLAISVRRSAYFGPIVALLTVLTLATGLALVLFQAALGVILRRQLPECLVLGGLLFITAEVVCLVYLLVRVLFEPAEDRALVAQRTT